MALRKPLVISSGQVQQLQAGDTLDAPQSGGDITVITNDESSPVVIGTPVYIDANDGFKKAKADASATKDVFGLANGTITNGLTGPVMSGGILTATTAQWDAVAGTTGGLTKGTRYFLSATTAGNLTATAPSTVGQYVVEVGIAISTTELLVRIQKDILL
jgi:hypothetical protein